MYPLLATQLEIYQTARGPARFKEYLDTLRDDSGDMELPLSLMNPMAKAHVPKLLEDYLALGADTIVATAIADCVAQHQAIAGDFKVALVLVDDALGGWTHRQQVECNKLLNGNAELRRGWITVLLWSSDAPNADTVYKETSRSIYRAAHVLEHGWPQTLADALRQEGAALHKAGIALPPVDDIQAELIEICLEDTAYDTILSCLFGDAAGETLGYQPLGLEKDAGLRYALQQHTLSRSSG